MTTYAVALRSNHAHLSTEDTVYLSGLTRDEAMRIARGMNNLTSSHQLERYPVVVRDDLVTLIAPPALDPRPKDQEKMRDDEPDEKAEMAVHL